MNYLIYKMKQKQVYNLIIDIYNLLDKELVDETLLNGNETLLTIKSKLKKPMTAYFLFLMENRLNVKEQLLYIYKDQFIFYISNLPVKPEGRDLLTSISTKLSEMWKSLDQVEKDKYIEQAKADKLRYNTEKADRGENDNDDDDAKADPATRIVLFFILCIIQNSIYHLRELKN